MYNKPENLLNIMQVKLNRWGNSWAVRLPVDYLKELSIDPLEPVDLSIEENSIKISKTKQYNIADLVAGITAQNQPELIDFGAHQGQEIW